MSTFTDYPAILQLYQAIDRIRKRVSFHQQPLPVLTFEGTVKVHGANVSFCSQNEQYWYQNRENILSQKLNQQGFYQFAEERKEYIQQLHRRFRLENNIPDDEILSIFGEWCGEGIQINVAVSQLSPRFIMFGVSVGPNGSRRWLSKEQLRSAIGCIQDQISTNIFSIYEFPTWSVDIDFKNPQLMQNVLVDITTKVTEECPIGKYFGIHNECGEGVVWSCTTPHFTDIKFKVKSQKHSVSNVRELAAVDVEKVKNVKEFVERTVTENRLIQMKQKLDNNPDLNYDGGKGRGAFLRLLIKDILKEESEVLQSSGLTVKDVTVGLSDAGKEWFIKNT